MRRTSIKMQRESYANGHSQIKKFKRLKILTIRISKRNKNCKRNIYNHKNKYIKCKEN